MTSRPRPVLLYGMASAAVAAFVSGASAVDLIPVRAVAVVALAWAVIGGAWALYVQSIVTPVEDPHDADGEPLVRLDDAVAAAAPPGSTRDLTAKDPHDRD
jgi:hypothetical protein